MWQLIVYCHFIVWRILIILTVSDLRYQGPVKCLGEFVKISLGPQCLIYFQ